MTRPSEASTVPYAVTDPTRIPAKRYYDQSFFDLEAQNLWSRVWQMACRLEEIPNVGDYVEYKILDQSIIVVRVAADRIKAYYNACRHRGMKLVKDRGTVRQGFSCSFHGWRFNLEGENTFIFQPDLFTDANRDADDLRLRECRVETWGACAFINMDDNAPPLKDSLEPFASYHDARMAGKTRVRWWYSAVVPANWKLTMEAFMEGYHVMRTHPQFLPPNFKIGPGAVYKPKGDVSSSSIARQVQSTAGDSSALIEASIHYLKTLWKGMDGMVLERDVRVAEGLRGTKLPSDPTEARTQWNRILAEAMTREHRKNGIPVPDFVEVAKTTSAAVQFCFPNFFLLPVYSGMSSYRFRPLGPESTLFEIWSLGIAGDGEPAGEPLKTPDPMAFDDPRWPEIPPQDFANVPGQQEGLHANGFDFMRLASHVEGLISHFHRALDGYLSGLPGRDLLPAVQNANGPIDVPIRDDVYRRATA